MTFECADLERALGTPELMPDARRHAAECARCRRELELWTAISQAGRELHQEWDSPELWPRIRQALAAEAPPRRFLWVGWRWAGAFAAVLLATVLLLRPWRPSAPPSRAFLTEQALREADAAETLYAQSIEKLARLAEPGLRKASSPLAANYRERLLVIDSAIADLKAGLERNRYNVYLRSQLDSLYREKQNTLQDWLRNEKND